MNSIVGFTVKLALPRQQRQAADEAQHRALRHFPHLTRLTIHAGQTQLDIWGRGNLAGCIHHLPDGALLARVGSPHGQLLWPRVQKKLLQAARPEALHIPWDGRFILLSISADGTCWTTWNDWLGSIPLFHAPIGPGRIASTLEPVVVAAAKFSPDDIFLPGLLSLLINGHFLGDWTLFKGMKIAPPDCAASWDDRGFHSTQLWTIKPGTDRWEAGRDDMIDEMHELSRQAIADVLNTQPNWIVPLSSGLDSRLIAAVGAEIGANMRTYAWGEPETTDVIFSRQVAKALDFPWKHIDVGTDYLTRYTRQWADWCGSGLHFHGMYMMSFLDALKSEPDGAILPGLVGDTLAGDAVKGLLCLHSQPKTYQAVDNWHVFWTTQELKSLLKVPIVDALEANAAELKRQINSVPGAYFQKLQFLELWGRQRLFISFQATLGDYWRGVGTPFLNRAYAQFCMSLPRSVLDNRCLLGDMFRRHYGLLATIPGTYANEPHILTGRYLLKRRIAKILPRLLRRGPFSGTEMVPLRMDMHSARATGQASFWPVYQVRDQLEEWLDVAQLDLAYQQLMADTRDVRPLRKFQTVQALALRLRANGTGLAGEQT